MRSLLGDGAEAGAADDDGWTPLHFAAQSWSVEAVDLLLDHGAPVDPKNAHGNTPLAIAVKNSRGRGEVILKLRDAGADPWSVNRFGNSPVVTARLIANFDVARYFSDLPAQAN